ncbi:hypothetical protein ACP70R_027804 [Stipagrostis hirtigluma subsp. patula]
MQYGAKQTQPAKFANPAHTSPPSHAPPAAAAAASSATMLRLKQHLLSNLRRRRVAAPLPAASLHLLSLSTAAATTQPTEFVTEDYLVASCGLTPAQARKASKYLPHLRSADKPDAVRAFLAEIGLAKADVAAAVVRYPSLISCKVDKTQTRLALLREIGLSPPQISRLITVSPETLFSPVKISRLAFYLSFLGSYDKVHSVLKNCDYLLRQDLDNVVRPNIAVLQQCGLTDNDIGKQFLRNSRMLLSQPEHLKEILLRAEQLGVPRSSGTFKHALLVVYGLNPGTFSARLKFLKKVLGCSEAEVAMAVRKSPTIVKQSEGKMARTVEFLKVVVGLQSSYIVHRPALLGYSIEKRLVPRHYIIKVLKAKGLMKEETDFYNVICVSEKSFVEKFIVHYNDRVPGLIDAYAAACAGQVPPEL